MIGLIMPVAPHGSGDSDPSCTTRILGPDSDSARRNPVGVGPGPVVQRLHWPGGFKLGQCHGASLQSLA